MADEIKKLGFSQGEADVLFLYDLGGTKTYNDASGTPVTIIPTPSASLADYTSELNGSHTIATDIVSAAEKAQLDAGTHAFEIVRIPMPIDKPNAEILAEAQLKYVAKKAAFINRLNTVYFKTGAEFDAPP